MIKDVEKINILFHRKDREAILNFLQNNRLVEIIGKESPYKIKREDDENKKNELHTKKAEVEYVLSFLSSFEGKLKKSFREKLEQIFSPKIFLTEEEIKSNLEKFNFAWVLEECKAGEARINELNNQLEELYRRKQLYQKWKLFPYARKDLEGLEGLRILIGTTSQWELFKNEIEKKTKLYELMILETKKSIIKFCLFYHPRAEKEIKEVLEKNKVKIEEEVKELKNLPRAEIKEINKKLNELLRERNLLTIKIRSLFFSARENLKIMSDYLTWEEKKIEVALQGFYTSYLVSLKCWLEKDRLKELEKGLKKITKDFAIFKLKIGKDDKPPLILRHRKFLRPLEFITNMYGTPKKEEIDPLPFMTPFFILFFAFCLGDAGYGILLFSIPLLAIKILKIPEEKRDFLELLIYLGLATFFAGLFFGSCFGINVKFLKIADPLKNPLQVLFLSLILGICQIIFGLFLNLYREIKTNGLREGFLNGFPLIYLIFALLLFFGVKSNFIPLEKEIAKYLILSGLLFLVLSQGRKARNLFLKIFSGVGNLYNLIGYFSDVISYSRLLALGLATTVIAQVVNLLAGMVKEMVPFVGLIISLFILIFGHLFNLVISSFGAFIHSMRLQFVEFFPKFIIGGGRTFEPFSKEGKYIELKF